jgi:putative transposase
MFVEGVLWIVRTGSPWRGLPEVFGDWNSDFRRFSRWIQKGVWRRLFEAMSDDPDFEYLIVDSTIVCAHQHASGAKRGLKIRPSDAHACGGDTISRSDVFTTGGLADYESPKRSSMRSDQRW